jgi:anti-sigma factor RsiW
MNELKDYLLGELTPAEKRAVEERLAADAAYRLEYERLSLTQNALLAVPEPEMPRRIAFVSDPVFENKPTFWQRLVGPAWAYGCAAMLSAAILAHGFLSGGGAPAGEAALQARIDKAVAEVRAENDRRHEQMVVAVEKTFDYMRKESLRVERASYEEGRQ